VPRSRPSPSAPPTFFRAAPFLASLAIMTGCGGPQSRTGDPSTESPDITCPEPIGTIPRENCTEIADDFGALDVSSALKIAGSSRGSELRIQAIREVADLATVIKDRRVTLCESYNACKVPSADHAAEDQRLATLMKSLIERWDARNFLAKEGVESFRSEVQKIAKQVDANTSDTNPNAPQSPAQKRIRGEDLQKIEGPGLSFSPASGSITITSTTPGPHDALRTPLTAPLGSTSKLRIRISGSFTPKTPALITPGDELTVRFKYRTTRAGNLIVALRSLEDPDALDTTSTLNVAAGKGSREASFTALPGASGFYLALGAQDVGPFDLDDIELLRANAPIATARAESSPEPHLTTRCTLSPTSPLAGKASFHCEASEGDALTLGSPKAHLYLALRSQNGERARLRTLSLEGGRSLHASTKEDAELIIGLEGEGRATIQSVELSPAM